MNKRETAQALADSVQPGEFEDRKSMLADDFQFMTTLQLSGAHSGSFALTNMNMSVISVTHKAFSVKGKARLTVKDHKSTAWVIEEPKASACKRS